MQIKIDVSGGDRLQLALAKIPDAVERELRLGMRESVRDVAEYARNNHRFISRSGALEQSITETVEQDGGQTYGLIELNPAGTRTKDGRSYGVFQHDGTDDAGTGSHRVAPVHRKALRWASGGRFVFSKGHMVRGIKPDPFIYRAGETLTGNGHVQAIFDRRIDQALKEAGV